MGNDHEVWGRHERKLLAARSPSVLRTRVGEASCSRGAKGAQFAVRKVRRA